MIGITKRNPPRTYEECHRVIDGVIYKLCSDCNQWLPMTKEYYYKNKSASDGFNPYCKEDTKKRSWKWQKDNWDKMLIHFKKENAKPEKKPIKGESYRKAKEKGYYRDYYKEHKDKFKGYNQDRSLHKKHEINKQEWKDCKSYFDDSCAYCGMTYEEHKEKFNQDLSREHVDPEGANDLSNCVPSCKSCNSKKKLMGLEWYDSSNENYTEERYHKIIQWLRYDYIEYIEKD